MRIQIDSFQLDGLSTRFLFNIEYNCKISTFPVKLTKGKTFFISFGGTIFASRRDPNVCNSPRGGGFGWLPTVAADSMIFRTGSKRALIDTLRGNWNPSVAIAIEATVCRNIIFICMVYDKEQLHQVTFTPSIGRMTSWILHLSSRYTSDWVIDPSCCKQVVYRNISSSLIMNTYEEKFLGVRCL